MNWYLVIMTNKELQQGMDGQLETAFNYLYNELNQPANMALYRSRLLGDMHQYYYIRMPEGLSYDLGNVFNQFRIKLASEPDIKELTLAVGNTEADPVLQ